jgi:F-type H+-transporting ATPase subunit a
MIKKNFYKSKMVALFATLLLVFTFSGSSQEQSRVSGDSSAAKQEKAVKAETSKEFNAGEMIVEHVIDAHEWHIATVGHTQITIPLPVILLDKGKLVVFLSNRFHHGTQAYGGYKLETEGTYKGKIVKVKEDGSVDEAAKIPLDFSISKLVAQLFISLLLLCVVFISIARRYKENPNRSPQGLQSLLEPIILFVRDDIAIPALGEKKYQRYIPYLLTVFFFIFFSNLLGLVPFFPGGANLTGNLAVTMVLAVTTFIITTISGNKAYWMDIVNTPGVPWWLKIPFPLMPIIEIIGMITKPFVLMVRLFANILAGHIIGLGFMSLIFIFGLMNPALGYAISPVSVLFGVFMTFLELLVAFIQAYVFTLLSALYFGMATAEHHHETVEEPAH